MQSVNLGNDRLGPKGRGEGKGQRGQKGWQPAGDALSGSQGGQAQQNKVDDQDSGGGKDSRGQVHAPGHAIQRQEREQLAEQDVEGVAGGMRHSQAGDDDLKLKGVGQADGGQQRAQVERKRRKAQRGGNRPPRPLSPRRQQCQRRPADQQHAAGQRMRYNAGDVEEGKEQGSRGVEGQGALPQGESYPSTDAGYPNDSQRGDV